MAVTILSNPVVRDVLLPFVLVFALVFAVLEKSEVFGKDKKQTNAIIALAIGLMVVAVGYATDLINNLMPVLAVGLVVLLVFMLLWGMVFKAGAFDMPVSVKNAVGVIAAIVVVAALIYFTNSWGYIKDFFAGALEGWMSNIILIIIVIVAIVVVLYPFGEGKKS
ncbi:MAG: hypothetical protein N3D20_01485 [Candidatus Pacearchaeota archaeon]|nr:hypothetical protein [Candidatus Pacearchaeota archaeon]